jgi:hypothetical protein
MGVLDPTKVTRTALQNAASIAGLMLTTDCMVAELAEEKPAMGGGMAAWWHGRYGWHGRHGRHGHVMSPRAVFVQKKPRYGGVFFARKGGSGSRNGSNSIESGSSPTRAGLSRGIVP